MIWHPIHKVKLTETNLDFILCEYLIKLEMEVYFQSITGASENLAAFFVLIFTFLWFIF